ncbi:MAG: S-layer homology domain-containing protein [Clostridia bacterium]|nr:S-layer homology domain-containing protein [Clostridia bacterium]
MKKHRIPKIFASIIVCVMLSSLCVQASSVSPALDIIAGEYGLIKVSLISRDVYFESTDFTEATGLEEIKEISIVSLPDSSTGTLMLGNLAVSEGQNISKRNFDNLRFVPRTGNETEASFDFAADSGSSTAYTCSIYLLERENGAPSTQTGLSASLSTYGGMPVFGTLKASDPENDPIKYEIVTYPTQGTLVLTDSSFGNYTYTPDNNYSGTDYFEYIATDKYGKSSELTRVSLNVREPETNIVFSDLDGHWAHYASIRCAVSGAMSFSSSDGLYTFSPDAPVSRAEFCAALMKNAGYSGFTSVSGTGYADDTDIPEEYKGYIAAASVLGVTKGVGNGEAVSFCPNNQITRAEAAVMIERLYGFSNDIEVSADATVAVFNDGDIVPAWAAESMSVLSAAGIINGSTDGNISPYVGLTRAQVAVMLNNISESGITR